MKKLSDYKDEEAIELWADLLDPMTVILQDAEVKETINSGLPKIEIAKVILKNHSKEAIEILRRIDDTEIDGLNIVLRLVGLLADIGQNEAIKSFFGYAEQVNKESQSSGSATVTTQEKES